MTSQSRLVCDARELSRPGIWRGLVVASFAAAAAVIYYQFVRRRQRKNRPKGEQARCYVAEENNDIQRDFDDAAQWVGESGSGLSNEAKLRLYGFFKQATAGDCTFTRPWGMEASLKWDAWAKIRGISQEEAMLKYVDTLKDIVPGWGPSSTALEGPVQKNIMGPVVSLMGCIGDPSKEHDVDSSTVGQFNEMITSGDVESVREALSLSPSLGFQRDKDGMTALHWAADRGELDIIQALLGLLGEGDVAVSRINAQDEEGNTPLHFAVMTENVEIARALVARGADSSVENEEGESPMMAAPSQPEWKEILTCS